MYSGDIRRSLQITKRAVELCRDEHFSHPKGKLPKEKGSSRRFLNKDGLSMTDLWDVNNAFNQLFNSKTVKVLQSLRTNEVIVLLSIFSVLRSQKAEKVLLDKVHDQCNYFLRTILRYGIIKSSVFREIVKRLQAFGLVSLQIEHQKLTDNVHLQLLIFNDELATAYKEIKSYDYVQTLAESYGPLKELFEQRREL